MAQEPTVNKSKNGKTGLRTKDDKSARTSRLNNGNQITEVSGSSRDTAAFRNTEKILPQQTDELAMQLEFAKDDLKRESDSHRVTKAALLKSEMLVNKMLACSKSAIFIIDAETTCVMDCSPSVSEIFGYQPKEVLNETVDFLHVDALSLEDFRNHLYTGLPQNDFLFLPQFKMKRKDGTIFPTEHSVVPLKNDQNKITEWISVVRDMTERKEAESALKESEDRYRMLVETMGEALGIQDKNGIIIYANDKYLNMLGRFMEEVIGHSPLEFLDMANRKILKKESIKRKSGKLGSYEITWSRKDGQKVDTIISPRDLFSADGAYDGTFAVITDITELKLALQALQEKEKELQLKSRHLEETNTALKVLLKRRAKDKSRLEEAALINVKELVDPYLEKLKNSGLNQSQKNLLSIIASNLNDLTSPFTRKLSVKLLKLTPTEIQVANFVKQGKTTKEMAEILNLSSKTIEFHRDNIRDKIGIKNKGINLRTRLLSFQ